MRNINFNKLYLIKIFQLKHNYYLKMMIFIFLLKSFLLKIEPFIIEQLNEKKKESAENVIRMKIIIQKNVLI